MKTSLFCLVEQPQPEGDILSQVELALSFEVSSVMRGSSTIGLPVCLPICLPGLPGLPGLHCLQGKKSVQFCATQLSLLVFNLLPRLFSQHTKLLARMSHSNPPVFISSLIS